MTHQLDTQRRPLEMPDAAELHRRAEAIVATLTRDQVCQLAEVH